MKLILSESQMNVILEMMSIDMNEDIYLKKDEQRKELVVFSDAPDEKSRANETFKLKDKFKALGFRWNGRAWAGDYSKLGEINKIIKTYNKARAIIDKLDDLENFIEDDSDLPADKKKEIVTKIEMYINDLANATESAAMDAAIRNYLTFFSKFHQYSLNNVLLIMLQKKDATKVASYNNWKKKFKRGVKTGATRIAIWVPLTKKSIDDLGRETTDLVAFKIGYVFDISDTYPLSGDGEIPEEPQWWGDKTASDTAHLLIEKLKIVASNLNIKLTKETAKGGEKGYSAGGHINLSSDIEGVGEASTLVHELAHELLHWKEKSPFYVQDPDYNTREMKELQAESVSYVIMKHYELPVSHHPTYLALWRANKDKIMKNFEIIQKCAKFIIGKIDGVDYKEDENLD